MRQWRLIPTRRDVLLAAGLVVTPGTSAGQISPRKPKLKPGKDPGGVAVALIGSGVDYTVAAVAAGLARDGEGEAIAFDTLDGDAQPFDAPPPWATPLTVAGTEMARQLLSEAQGCRIIPIRVSDQNVLILAKALSFAGRTPARVAVLLAGPGRDEGHEALAKAVGSFPGLLVVMPAGKVLRFLDKETPLTLGLGNLVTVTAAGTAAEALPALPADAARIDVAVALEASVRAPAGMVPLDAVSWLENRAAVRLAAVACRLLAAGGGADGAAVKSRLLALARPAAGADGGRTRAGIIVAAETEAGPGR